MLPHFTHEHLPEVISHEEIEDRIDGTVQKGQRSSHNVQGVDNSLCTSELFQVLQAGSNPHVSHDVVGSEEHGKDHNRHDDQVERLFKGQRDNSLPIPLL